GGEGAQALGGQHEACQASSVPYPIRRCFRSVDSSSDGSVPFMRYVTMLAMWCRWPDTPWWHAKAQEFVRFCRKVRFLGRNRKIGYKKFNAFQTAKISKKQLCDRPPQTFPRQSLGHRCWPWLYDTLPGESPFCRHGHTGPRTARTVQP